MQNLKQHILWTGTLTSPLFFLVGTQMAFSQQQSPWLYYCVIVFFLTPIIGFTCSLVLCYQNFRFQDYTLSNLKLYFVSIINSFVLLWQSRHSRMFCLLVFTGLNGFMSYATLYLLYFSPSIN